jgi:hypothetical protein
MVEYESLQVQWPLGPPTRTHSLREQVTIVKGWTQLLARYSADPQNGDEDGIRKGLARIDAASTHLAELLGQSPPYGRTVAASVVSIAE